MATELLHPHFRIGKSFVFSWNKLKDINCPSSYCLDPIHDTSYMEMVSVIHFSVVALYPIWKDTRDLYKLVNVLFITPDQHFIFLYTGDTLEDRADLDSYGWYPYQACVSFHYYFPEPKPEPNTPVWILHQCNSENGGLLFTPGVALDNQMIRSRGKVKIYDEDRIYVIR